MTDDRTFSAELVEADGEVVVALIGDLDLAARERFHSVFEEVRATAKPVALDVSRLAFADSTGVGCLCYARNAVFENTGRAPRLIGARTWLRQLLTLSGIDDLFDLTDAPQ